MAPVSDLSISFLLHNFAIIFYCCFFIIFFLRECLSPVTDFFEILVDNKNDIIIMNDLKKNAIQKLFFIGNSARTDRHSPLQTTYQLLVKQFLIIFRLPNVTKSSLINFFDLFLFMIFWCIDKDYIRIIYCAFRVARSFQILEILYSRFSINNVNEN